MPFCLQDALVAAFIGNCHFSTNGRTQLLRELIQLLPGQVHSYGGCFHNKDIEPGTSSTDSKYMESRYRQKQEVLSRYKFAFVPENSNDAGYVTEKIYHALRAGAVPIYMGAPDIARFIPSMDGVILASDFNSTVELADHIRRVGSESALWAQYAAWKTRPEEQWSEGWHELQRLQARTWACRTAMHMAGTPHRWRAAEV